MNLFTGSKNTPTDHVPLPDGIAVKLDDVAQIIAEPTAQETEDFSLGNIKRDTLNCLKGAKVLGQVFGSDDGHGF